MDVTAVLEQGNGNAQTDHSLRCGHGDDKKGEGLTAMIPRKLLFYQDLIL